MNRSGGWLVPLIILFMPLASGLWGRMTPATAQEEHGTVREPMQIAAYPLQGSLTPSKALQPSDSVKAFDTTAPVVRPRTSSQQTSPAAPPIETVPKSQPATFTSTSHGGLSLRQKTIKLAQAPPRWHSVAPHINAADKDLKKILILIQEMASLLNNSDVRLRVAEDRWTKIVRNVREEVAKSRTIIGNVRSLERSQVRERMRLNTMNRQLQTNQSRLASLLNDIRNEMNSVRESSRKIVQSGRTVQSMQSGSQKVRASSARVEPKKTRIVVATGVPVVESATPNRLRLGLADRKIVDNGTILLRGRNLEKITRAMMIPVDVAAGRRSPGPWYPSGIQRIAPGPDPGTLQLFIYSSSSGMAASWNPGTYRIKLFYGENGQNAVTVSLYVARIELIEGFRNVDKDNLSAIQTIGETGETAFQNFDQKSNQLFNILSTVMKSMKEMQEGVTRNTL
jgi:hypothetical protein